MSSKERYVIVGVIVLAVILGLTLSKGLQWSWVQVGWDDPFLFNVRELPLTSVISFGIAALAAIVVLRHTPTRALANEVVDELSKVTWPSREETGNATVVVIVTVFICAAYLGAFDAIWLALTDWILDIEPLVEG